MKRKIINESEKRERKKVLRKVGKNISKILFLSLSALNLSMVKSKVKNEIRNKKRELKKIISPKIPASKGSIKIIKTREIIKAKIRLIKMIIKYFRIDIDGFQFNNLAL